MENPMSKTESLSEMIKRFYEQLDDHKKLQRMMAELHRTKYLACLAEGFTEAQALELCKNV